MPPPYLERPRADPADLAVVPLPYGLTPTAVIAAINDIYAYYTPSTGRASTTGMTGWRT
jgi:hypothetical protein